MKTKPAKVVHARERSETGERFEPLRECARCGFVACACRVIREHRAPCPWRRAVLGPFGDEQPLLCLVHNETACRVCYPCSCGDASAGSNRSVRNTPEHGHAAAGGKGAVVE